MANYLPLNKFIMRDILLRTNYDDIINYCRTCTYAIYVCKDNDFWMEKAFMEFGISSDLFKNTDLIPAQRYLELLTNNGGVGIGSEYFTLISECMKRAIRQDNSHLVQYLLRFFDDYDLIILEYTAKGDLEMIIKYLPLSESCFIYEEIAKKAIENGRIKTFEYINGMGSIVLDPNKILEAAARSGHFPTYNYILSLYPSHPTANHSVLIHNAVKSGNKQFVLDLLAKVKNVKWANLLQTTIDIHDLEMFKCIYELSFKRHLRFYDQNITFDHLLHYAIKIGDDELYNEILKETKSIPCKHEYQYLREFKKTGNNNLEKDLKIIDNIWSDVCDSHIFFKNIAKTENIDYIRHVWEKNQSLNRSKYLERILITYCMDSGIPRIIDYVLSQKCNDIDVDDWNLLFYSISDKMTFEHYYGLMPSTYIDKLKWEGFISYAADKDFFVYLNNLKPSNIKIDYNDVLIKCVQEGKNKLFHYILSVIPSICDVNWGEILNTARMYKNIYWGY